MKGKCLDTSGINTAKSPSCSRFVWGGGVCREADLIVAWFRLAYRITLPTLVYKKTSYAVTGLIIFLEARIGVEPT